jgi:hypothetical protein
MEQIADPDNLRLAFWKAQRGKRYSKAVIRYRANLDAHLLQLRQELFDGEVSIGDYHFFKVYDPKERDICAPAFREQVLHHALMNVCHTHFERKQIHDSYASRKGKGTYAAIDRAKGYTLKYGYYLKLDVRKFFGSLPHDVLKQQLRQLFKDEKLWCILSQIVDSYPAEESRGVPIGNLTSQYFANHYLSGLDHYIKEQLKSKAYVRYMDDMVLWHDDKQKLQSWVVAIEEYVEHQLRLSLKPLQLNTTKRGLPFLGYIIFPHYVRLSQRSKQRFAKKIKALQIGYDTAAMAEADCQRKALPLIAFTHHADALEFRKNVLLGL